METGACEADEGAEFGGSPLRGGGRAVDAGEVCGAFLKGRELGRESICVMWEAKVRGGRGYLGLRFGVDFPHYDGSVDDGWSLM